MPTCRKGEVVGGLISIFGDIHFYIVLTEYNEYLYSSSKLTRDYQQLLPNVTFCQIKYEN